jgi:hypothetical protein
LLNPIDETEAALHFGFSFPAPATYGSRTLLIREEGDQVAGTIRLGPFIARPVTWGAAGGSLVDDLVIDAKAIGVQLFAFDLLALSETDLPERSYR